MTLSIAYVLGLLVVALVLFASDKLSVDVVGLIVLLCLAVPRVLTPLEALSGFGNETILILISLFVVTAGIVRTGVVERLGLWLASVGSSNPSRLTRVILGSAAAVSSFLSNTVTTAVFLPIMIGVARRTAVALSRVLMPLAFASILAGSVTLIGTSTNLVISSQLPRYGLAPIGFFELAPVGVVITILGLLYLFFLAPGLVPDRGERDMTDRYDLRRYLSEALIQPGSRLAGKSLAESQLGSAMNLNVVGIVRGERRTLAPGPHATLAENDILIIEGKAEDILSVKDAGGIEIRPDVKPALSDGDLQSERIRMMEAMVLPHSDLVGRTLRESRFRERTGVTVLAIHSAGGPDRIEKLSGIRLKPSDVLLLQGSLEALDRVRGGGELFLLEDVSAHHPRRRKGRWAAAIFIGSVAVAVAGLLPLPLAFIAGGVALVITRCMTPQEAYESVDWRLMVMIGCMIAFGLAMEKTGTAAFLSDLIVRHLSGLGSTALLAAFFVLTVLLTQPMSNQAAALVVLPIAVATANKLGLNPRSFVMCVTFAASCSFLTPLEPSCVLVYGPGRYRFFDFTRVGLPLTALVFVVSMLLVPLVWPLGR
ncbi:MAG TPA: SLC13 family permease [Thermoanaerobaculia bacterium]|nr:SLC13 family permease [Thermoanaerobaculia bacterium]